MNRMLNSTSYYCLNERDDIEAIDAVTEKQTKALMQMGAVCAVVSALIMTKVSSSILGNFTRYLNRLIDDT